MHSVTMVDKIEEYFVTHKDGEIYRSAIDSTEKILIEKALARTLGNQLLAAKILGINRNTLRAKIRRLHIDIEQFAMYSKDIP